ncbi:phosphoglycerate dehydrogenase [Vibrio sp. SCSIO 43137]|uniref:phosphoglycerate dehydrogenase n=1 Tax=Vibrio sp. SCSIO 43137 TaxID=3021011 RepID=UPI002307212B|nr:phosphoglycerate dehydrogenase [Vibrio sp. SCSIO 43137]WCE29868.1 phosphoglycerate dehydrogenase [Vibrio sp. SCSIO 43137]
MRIQDSTVINDLTIGITTVAFSKDKDLVNTIHNQGFKKVLINQPQRRFTQDELIEFLAKCDIAIVGLDKINDEVLSRVPKLKAISKYGVGLDNIDFEACHRHNVKVLHTQGVNKRSVSELALGCMLSLSRRIYVTSNELKAGDWNKQGGMQVTGKKVGIIGVGHIGKDIIELLKPFGCEILVNDIIDQQSYYKENGLVEATKEEIFKNADIISIHTPLTEELKYFINKDSLSLMKKRAIVINTARGGLINQDDLKWALKNNIIAGAAIDAYEVEPPTDSELISLPNLITTPHIGGNANEAVQAMGLAAIDNIVAYCQKD